MAPNALEVIQGKVEKAAVLFAKLLDDEKDILRKLKQGQNGKAIRDIASVYRAQSRVWSLFEGSFLKQGPIENAQGELSVLERQATPDVARVIGELKGLLQLIQANQAGMVANAAGKLDFLERNKDGLRPEALAAALEQRASQAPLQPQMLLVLAQQIKAVGGYRRLALIDQLTGALNARGYDQRIREEVAKCERDPKYSFSLVMIDLNDFKPINDQYGHDIGDEALRVLVQQMRAAVRPSDLVVRKGGDEFAIILPGETCAGSKAVVGRLQALLSKPVVEVPGKAPLRLSISYGCAEHRKGKPLKRTEREADTAMYSNKEVYKSSRQMRKIVLPEEQPRKSWFKRLLGR
jgi:diguanylate cyclase (GGDEF)-like protein